MLQDWRDISRFRTVIYEWPLSPHPPNYMLKTMNTCLKQQTLQFHNLDPLTAQLNRTVETAYPTIVKISYTLFNFQNVTACLVNVKKSSCPNLLQIPLTGVSFSMDSTSSFVSTFQSLMEPSNDPDKTNVPFWHAERQVTARVCPINTDLRLPDSSQSLIEPSSADVRIIYGRR